jgi:hypothetical protein
MGKLIDIVKAGKQLCKKESFKHHRTHLNTLMAWHRRCSGKVVDTSKVSRLDADKYKEAKE